MRIAIVEDNADLANALSYRLNDKGHATDILPDGIEADEFLAGEGADLVVLDINLPSLSGLEVLSRMRSRGDGTPVILLTARSETHDRIEGLDVGADDYLTKPFDMDELEARIRALLRRRNIEYAPSETIGGISFDRSSRIVRAGADVVDIPRRELAVLECLLDRQGRIVSKAQLIDHVYGVGADVDDTAIEPHISRLRGRLSGHGVMIKTVRGLGYMIGAET